MLLAGTLLQSGGFFVHMVRGAPGERSLGTTLTTAGAVLMAVASLVLAWAVAYRW